MGIYSSVGMICVITSFHMEGFFRLASFITGWILIFAGSCEYRRDHKKEQSNETTK